MPMLRHNFIKQYTIIVLFYDKVNLYQAILLEHDCTFMKQVIKLKNLSRPV